MFGFFTLIKIGAVVATLAIASYFVLNYRHMQAKITTLETQVVEQHEVIAWYEQAADIDKETANVHNEIKQAVQANDPARVRALYERLRQHQRSAKDQAAPPAGDDGTND